MAKAPAFLWYPKDCDTDENVRLMSDEELGFYLRCLNHSWLNNGLPSNPDELCRIFKLSRVRFNKLWERVGKCFSIPIPTNGRLVNERQEEQRKKSKDYSASRQRIAHIRWCKDPECKNSAHAHGDAHASAMHTVCNALHKANENSSSSLKESKEKKEAPPEVDFGFEFDLLYRAHPYGGKRWEAQQIFFELLHKSEDPAKLLAEIKTGHSRWCTHWMQHPGMFVPLLWNWLEDRMWERPTPATPPSGIRRKPDNALNRRRDALEKAKQEVLGGSEAGQTHFGGFAGSDRVDAPEGQLPRRLRGTEAFCIGIDGRVVRTQVAGSFYREASSTALRAVLPGRIGVLRNGRGVESNPRNTRMAA